MERPRIRFIEAIPYEKDGQRLVILRDSEGISREALAVSGQVAFMVSLMDGTNTLRDIQAGFMSASGEMVSIEQIEDIVKVLDQNLFLYNDRYMAHVKALHDDYDRLPVRPACCAGRSYAASRMDLLSFLGGMFDGCAQEAPRAPGDISGILAPHIDYPRGESVYRRIYPYLKNAPKPLLVIFGTCHNPTQGLWSISLKDFETPLERVPVDRKLKELIRGNGFLKRYIEEWPHRNEHSIELQLPLIQFMVQDDFEILPILTGSMHEYIEGEKNIDNDEVVQLTQNLRSALDAYGKPYCVIAGADLAHIGAQFGDRYALDALTMERSRKKDEMLLGHIRNVDAGGFFEEVREEGDRRRICGLTPIFFQLKLLEGSRGEIVDYDQWTDGHSSVSFAGGYFCRQ
jgi:MEMO1 family protein